MNTDQVIFYAEDNHDDRELFANVMTELGKESGIHFQNNGDELLSEMNYETIMPDLIFLDLNMPGRTGFQVLQEIREMEKFKNLPIIILSSASDPVAADRAKKLGANLFLTKPSSYSKFKELLKVILEIDWHNNTLTTPFHMNIN